MRTTSNNNKSNIVPIFYACDDAFVKYTIVSIKSMLDNADKSKFYKIYILNVGISDEMKKETYKLNSEISDIEFICVKDQLKKIATDLPIRDYYSKTTYFRLFIAEMFPQYDKAVYIDSDTIVLGDISKFFEHDLKDNYVGACHDLVMMQTEVYGNYVEKVMGIDRNNFFNAGHLLINCKAFRQNKVLKQFIDLLQVYTFVVTQDEDYLNVICHNKVFWIDQGWNTEVYGQIPVQGKDFKVVHYIMVSKPWHYKDCRLKEYFWKYAKQVDVYPLILNELESYTDQQRENDFASCEKLAITAKNESERIDRYINLVSKKKAHNGSKCLKGFVNTKKTASLMLT